MMREGPIETKYEISRGFRFHVSRWKLKDTGMRRSKVKSNVVESFVQRPSKVKSNVVESFVQRPYILSGYRPTRKSSRFYLVNLFSVHNEAFDIWST